MLGETTTRWEQSRELAGSVVSLTVGPVRSGTGTSTARVSVSAPLMLTAHGFAGDEPLAPRDPDEAVTAYPAEHYAVWSEVFGRSLPAATFGENATTRGLLETAVFVGDTFEWGKATIQVSGPRRTDPEVGLRLGVIDLPTRLDGAGQTGFAFRVLNAGKVGPDDRLQLVDVDPVGLSVADVVTALTSGPAAAGLSIERVVLTQHVLGAHWLAVLAQRHPEQVEGSSEQLIGTAG